MSAGAELARRSTLDLTRPPTEQWDPEMMRLVSSQVLKRAATLGEQIYCLSVADALGLNPFIDEVYFLPTRSTDGSGPGIKPYIGRNGLVKKATERNYYFEAETVRANDRFRVVRKAEGERTCTHSYGQESERGEIVGAYAFLHDRAGVERPAFFYAPLEDYLPTFDADWKMGKSPWGNQRSAMIEKCAMIGAGRERLHLGGVLIDGEVDRVVQQEAMQRAAQPRDSSPTPVAEFDWSSVPGDPRVVDRLRAATFAVNDFAPNTWTAAKLQMVLTNMDEAALLAHTEQVERDAQAQRAERPDEEIPDAEVVSDPPPDVRERMEMLKNRIADLRLQHEAAETDEDHALINEEIDRVANELLALGDDDQGSLL